MPFSIICPITDPSNQALQWELIDVADVKQMAFIEIRTGSILVQVERVDQDRIAAVRGIVERVAVGIRDASREWSTGSSQCELKGVIARVGDILERKNPTQTLEGPPGQRIHVSDKWIGTRCLHINVGWVLWRNLPSILKEKRRVAVSRVTGYSAGSNSAIVDRE